MADQSILHILRKDVEAWNEWRVRNPSIGVPDFSEADLSGAVSGDLSRANLRGANLYGANLRGANLSGANLSEANLSTANLFDANLSGANLSEADLSSALLHGAILNGADLSDADLYTVDLSGLDLSKVDLSSAKLYRADLSGADLSGADLSRADLTEADLRMANLTEADLSGANLQYCSLVRANFKGSTLTNCHIYGISAWDLMVSEETEQSNLVITPKEGKAFATVDDLEVAQFVYLLFENRKLRNIIQTMTSKAVLILGNFAPDRMEILQAIRERLRDNGYLPILFDFEGAENRNLIDTVTTVARLVRFVIADLTQPISVPAELGAIVPTIESLPVQPLIKEPEEPYGMFSDVVERHSVLKVHHYKDLEHLLESFDDAVIAPAEYKFGELKEARVRAIKDKL